MKLAIPTFVLVALVTVSHAITQAQNLPEMHADTVQSAEDSVAGQGDPIGQPFQMGETQAKSATIPANRTIKSESFFKSPTGTLLKSVVFPGWGQLSNGKEQKAAVYFGIEGYWIAKSLVWRHRARTATNLSEFAHARDRRNYFYWLTGITVFVSMFDAYADRYLLTLERTRNMPEDFWGQAADINSEKGWRLSLAVKF